MSSNYTGKAPIYQKWDEKAFQFDTMHLHWMARSLYRALLQTAWHLSTRPDLPDNDEQLRQIACGGDVDVWKKHGPAVRAMFTSDADRGVLWQKRLREDWRALTDYRQKQKEHAELQHKAKQSREEQSKEAATAEPVASHQQATAKPYLPPSLPSLAGHSGNGSGSDAAEAEKMPAAPRDDGRELPSSAKAASEDRSRPPSENGENQKRGQGKPTADVTYLQSVSFELGLQLPTPEAVETLLDKYPVVEIEDALREYVGGLADPSFAEKLFFADGSGAAVILARRRQQMEEEAR